MPNPTQQIDALKNPVSASFIVAMLAEQRAVLGTKNDVYAAPLVTLATQAITQVCDLHGLPAPSVDTPSVPTDGPPTESPPDGA